MGQNSLLTNITNELGEEIKQKVEKISHQSSIYILYLVDINKVTDESLRIGFASYHAQYPNRTFDDYVRFKQNWDEDKYSYIIEPQGYFIDEDEAVKYAEENVGDINEAGSYPYVIIASMPLNRVYPMCNERTFRLFKFDELTDKYVEIHWTDDEGTVILFKRGLHGAF